MEATRDGEREKEREGPPAPGGEREGEGQLAKEERKRAGK